MPNLSKWCSYHTLGGTIRMIYLLVITLLYSEAIGSENRKLAQTGYQFLSVSSNARAGGMADAMTTIHGNSISLHFNPAGLSRQNTLLDFDFSSNNFIAGISHNSFSISLSPKNARYGVFGFSVLNVDYGKIQGTMVWDNQQGFIDTKEFNPSALAIGIGYGRALSRNFSIGGHLKTAAQYLGENVIPVTDSSNVVDKNVSNATAMDFGTIYTTDWHEFTFGMSIRNFSNEARFAYDGFQLPLTFSIGGSINLLSFLIPSNKSQSLLLAVDALHPRSFSERLNIGLEYSYSGFAMLRIGYLHNYDERSLTYGLGAKIGPVVINYALTPFGIFDTVSRISIGLVK